MTLKTVLGTLAALLSPLIRWMTARRIPLWVAPVALIIVIGGCSAVRAGSIEARTTKACNKAFKQHYGFFARPHISSVKTSRAQGIGQVEGRYRDEYFLCTYDNDSNRVYNFSAH